MPTLTWGFLMVKNTEGINTVFQTAIYYNTLMASPILGLGLAVFGYRERAVILLTALFLGLQNSKVEPYRKTCKMQLYRHTYLLSKTSRFLDNPFIEALRSTPQHTAQDSKPTSKKIILPTAPRISKLAKIKKHEYEYSSFYR